MQVLDGENVRAGPNSDLGFSAADRAENIRRLAEVAALFVESGYIVVTAFISTIRRDFGIVRETGGDRFHGIHVSADLQSRENRNTIDSYRRARAGKLVKFTRITALYGPPDAPGLVFGTTASSIDRCVAEMLSYVGGVTGHQEGRAQRL